MAFPGSPFALLLASAGPLRWISNLSPDAAVLVGTLGLLLIFIELNRPGRILPGALGLLTLLLAAGSLAQHALQPWACVLVLVAAGTLLLNWRRVLGVPALAFASLALIAGLRFLLVPSGVAHIHTLTAVLSGGGLGTLGSFLTRIAFRARRAKAID
jgi:membrane-bound serine protease (ClpP class)